MPALTNSRDEIFARELAKGRSATQAYEIAGYRPNRHNADALARQQHISTRAPRKIARSCNDTVRTHSLFRQGAMLYELIPMMLEPRLRPLIQGFGAMLLEIPVFAGVYGAV
jgi:hypothetical protein